MSKTCLAFHANCQKIFISSHPWTVNFSAGRYAWYNVDFSTGKPVYNTKQELSSRKAIATFIKQIKEKFDLDEVYLGGSMLLICCPIAKTAINTAFFTFCIGK